MNCDVRRGTQRLVLLNAVVAVVAAVRFVVRVLVSGDKGEERAHPALPARL